MCIAPFIQTGQLSLSWVRCIQYTSWRAFFKAIFSMLLFFQIFRLTVCNISIYYPFTAKTRKKGRKGERKKERRLFQLQESATCNVKSRVPSEVRLCRIFGSGSGPGTEPSASSSVVSCQVWFQLYVMQWEAGR